MAGGVYAIRSAASRRLTRTHIDQIREVVVDARYA